MMVNIFDVHHVPLIMAFATMNPVGVAMLTPFSLVHQAAVQYKPLMDKVAQLSVDIGILTALTTADLQLKTVGANA